MKSKTATEKPVGVVCQLTGKVIQPDEDIILFTHHALVVLVARLHDFLGILFTYEGMIDPEEYSNMEMSIGFLRAIVQRDGDIKIWSVELSDLANMRQRAYLSMLDFFHRFFSPNIAQKITASIVQADYRREWETYSCRVFTDVGIDLH